MMFKQVKVPVLGMIENMSGYTDPAPRFRDCAQQWLQVCHSERKRQSRGELAPRSLSL